VVKARGGSWHNGRPGGEETSPAPQKRSLGVVKDSVPSRCTIPRPPEPVPIDQGTAKRRVPEEENRVWSRALRPQHSSSRRVARCEEGRLLGALDRGRLLPSGSLRSPPLTTCPKRRRAPRRACRLAPRADSVYDSGAFKANPLASLGAAPDSGVASTAGRPGGGTGPTGRRFRSHEAPPIRDRCSSTSTS
jgi:hypothetical protein